LRRPGAGAPTDVHERPSWQISFPRRSPERTFRGLGHGRRLRNFALIVEIGRVGSARARGRSRIAGRGVKMRLSADVCRSYAEPHD